MRKAILMAAAAATLVPFVASEAGAQTTIINSNARRALTDVRASTDATFDGTGNTALAADGSNFRVGQVGVSGAENGLRRAVALFSLTPEQQAEILLATTVPGGSVSFLPGKQNAQGAPQPRVDFVLVDAGAVTSSTALTEASLISLYEAPAFFGASFNFSTAVVAPTNTPETPTLNVTGGIAALIAANGGTVPMNIAVRFQAGDSVAYNARDTVNDNLLFSSGIVFGSPIGNNETINAFSVVVPEPTSFALAGVAGLGLLARRRRA